MSEEVRQHDGGSAFARLSVDPWGKSHVTGGMSLRDYFAAAALTGGMANNPNINFETLAQDCYAAADAMLAARKQK